MNPFGLFTSFDWSNYVQAWGGMDRYLLNTVIVAVLSVLIGIPAAAAGAYGFVQSQFRFKQAVFYMYLGLLMVPGILTIIPLFLETKSFGLFDTMWALILPYAAGNQSFLIFLFRTFFEGIPDELFESSRIDGCTEFGILWRIVVPLSVPVMLTGTVLMFIEIWGDYLWPSIVLPNYHLLTVSAGLQLFLGSFGSSGLGAGAGFAAYVIVMIPMMLLVAGAMKWFVNGITGGALKG